MSNADAAPPSFFPALAARFTALIWSLLDAGLAKSALFYAERYFALDDTNHDARHLYATALLRALQTHSALFLVNHREDAVPCRACYEIKAQCCEKLGRHRQASQALARAAQVPVLGPSLSSEPRVTSALPSDAVLHARAGLAALQGNLPDQARAELLAALRLHPYLWEAFEGLCSLGNVPEIEELFPTRAHERRTYPSGEEGIARPATTGAAFFSPEPVSAGTNLFRRANAAEGNFRLGAVHPRESLASETSSYGEPSFLAAQPPSLRTKATSSQNSRPLSSPAEDGAPAHKKARTAHLGRAGTASSSESTVNGHAHRPEPHGAGNGTGLGAGDARMGVTNGKKAGQRAALGRTNAPPPAVKAAQRAAAKVDDSGTRRSLRLAGGTAAGGTKAAAKPSSTRTRATRPPPPAARTAESDDDPPRSASSASAAARPHTPAAAVQDEGAIMAEQYIYDLMRLFASAQRALASYDTALCMEELDKLPHKHQRSPHVMAMVGRAHYERTDYMAAERAFEAVRILEPYRMWDMEVYSTLLWHLRRKVQLAFLAQELLAVDPRAPQAWIAVGNTFSLERRRAQALSCFRRAAQLDEACAYAHTLAGHETIDEDVDRAVQEFQTALRADARHYNAWYGLGTCYLRMSKIRMAEYHYRKAAEIHPNNAVLLGCVGMAVERRGDREGALALFDEAVRLAPENALVRYRRAKMLIGMKRYEAAIKDLEVLRDSSPDESNVVFQLARAYRLVGDAVRSAQMLAVARDVSPKSVGKIKKLMETVKDGRADESMDEG